jgi:hypothetical protein
MKTCAIPTLIYHLPKDVQHDLRDPDVSGGILNKTGLTMEYVSNIILYLYSPGPTYGLDNVTVQEVVAIFDNFVPSFYSVKYIAACSRCNTMKNCAELLTR